MLLSWIHSGALWAAATDGAAAADAGVGGNNLLGMLMLPLLAVVFYFLIIRPESKRKKAAAKLRNELIVGDEITTIGGLVGRIVAIKDDAVTLETGADKVKIKIMRWAISSKGAQPAE
ncbi:MAG: preprotein translocase subunit YajC [Oscillospiraceae bacterium]|jgi:preprotein translocase subunit YajC|nr:preprotein translocase subunit YajC [Oscillospiraceae bacterium]